MDCNWPDLLRRWGGSAPTIHEQCRGCSQERMDEGCRRRDGQTLLHQTSEGGHLKVVELLIDKGADVEDTGKNRQMPLHQASEGGHLKEAELLIDKAQRKGHREPTNSFQSSVMKILMHCSHYDLVMALHSPLAYPWITERFPHYQDPLFRLQLDGQIAQSSEAMAQAARNLIIWTRTFDLNGANTHSYMLHYPMHAFMNLFIYIIKNPLAASVQKDLALLDVAVGYFGQMDFLTRSSLSFSFARDIATLARQTVDSCQTSQIAQ